MNTPVELRRRSDVILKSGSCNAHNHVPTLPGPTTFTFKFKQKHRNLQERLLCVTHMCWFHIKLQWLLIITTIRPQSVAADHSSVQEMTLLTCLPVNMQHIDCTGSISFVAVVVLIILISILQYEEYTRSSSAHTEQCISYIFHCSLKDIQGHSQTSLLWSAKGKCGTTFYHIIILALSLKVPQISDGKHWKWQFFTTTLSFDAPFPANPDKYLHRSY